jgi:hypothetical protein
MAKVEYESKWVAELRTAFLTERVDGRVVWIRQFKSKKYADQAKRAFEQGKKAG